MDNPHRVNQPTATAYATGTESVISQNTGGRGSSSQFRGNNEEPEFSA